uniref:Uncharacterized protein n=1 Tax=Romanomermis culicivorax TaxID=13658 RepID=A0A915IHL7_ROMCU
MTTVAEDDNASNRTDIWRKIRVGATRLVRSMLKDNIHCPANRGRKALEWRPM